MANFEPPSFSLGFDFDLPDSDPHTAPTTKDVRPPSAYNHFPVSGTILIDDDDDDFETLTVVDSESEHQCSPPKLKRLRRGSTVEDTVASASKVDLLSSVVFDDDDIEDFSSPEDNRTDEHFSTQHHSVCKSSKIPLSGNGVLTKQSGNIKQTGSNAPESVITNCNKPPFPKLSVSPLRRFQLIDSDSDYDDPYISEGATKKTYTGSEPHLNCGPPDLVQRVSLNEQRKLNESVKTSTKKDLWEDFQPEKSFRIPTPAFDEVCEEYFSSLNEKRTTQSNAGMNIRSTHVTNSVIDLGDPRPPAHQYFFHRDPRVQDLVRTRLPNFFPINAENRDSEQPSTSNIDYMGQFNCGESSKKVASTNKAETSSRKNSRKSKTQETSQGFMNPRLNTEKRAPRDAGKRRVQADGQSAGAGVGHWFTNQDGKRVYVGKNGQELTGRAAYMLYKKESGAGFKSKKAKKTVNKKK